MYSLELDETSAAIGHIGLAVLDLLEALDTMAVHGRVNVAHGAKASIDRVGDVVQEDVKEAVLARVDDHLAAVEELVAVAQQLDGLAVLEREATSVLLLIVVLLVGPVATATVATASVTIGSIVIASTITTRRVQHVVIVVLILIMSSFFFFKQLYNICRGQSEPLNMKCTCCVRPRCCHSC